MKTWQHSELGKFKLTDTGWQGQCTLPSFKMFRFGRPGRSKLEILFETENDSEDAPSSREISVAKRIIKNELALSKKLIRVLFDDLNGRGLNSGMWWHGDTESILEFMDEQLRSKCDLTLEDTIPKLIGSPSIWIRKEVDYYKKPCGVLLFDAAFDPEHGLGVLTDGVKIIGTGYQMSVGPFFEYQFRG